VRLWRDAGIAMKVAVNFCPKQFFEPDFVQQVCDILAETGASPDWIECEITESVLMSDRQAARDALQRLRQLGLTISIDDFGTGFSSLGYLTRFPVDVLKIDRSFVNQISDDESTRVIPDAIIAMAHKLGMKVIAEGVETEEQHRILTAEGCDAFQGYLFGRPMPSAQIDAWLAAADAIAG
jgi:EAL domain-containing protein (putative c-di-GMP-specific phosphodiesterase class I)